MKLNLLFICCRVCKLEFSVETLTNAASNQLQFQSCEQSKSDQESKDNRMNNSTDDVALILNDETSMTSLSTRSYLDVSTLPSRSAELRQRSNSAASKITNFKPVILHRNIVDIHKYLSQPRTFDFIDTYPGSNHINQQISPRLQPLINKLKTTWDADTAENYAEFEIIWKNTEGISPEFHAEYLNKFYEEFYRLCVNQLDQRIVHNFELLEDNNKVALWDSIWNSIHYAKNVSLVNGLEELAYHESIESILCYLMDDAAGADAPLLIYCEETDNNTREIPSFAHSFTASAFNYIQQYFQKEGSDFLFVFRALNQPVKLEQLLQDIVSQISCATLLSVAQILPNPQTATLNTLIENLNNYPGYSLKLMIIGIEYIQPNIYCASKDELNTSIPPYILEPNNFPHQLPSGYKIIMSTSVMDRGPDCQLIPHPLCLNLVIKKLSTDACFDWLKRKLYNLNISLGREQEAELSTLVIGIQQSNLRHFTLKQLLKLFAQNTVNRIILKDVELQRILMENDVLFKDNLASLFGKDTINLIINILQEKGGFTFNELEDLLSLQNKAVETHNVKHLKDALRFPQGLICLILFLLKLNNCKLNSGYDFHQDGYDVHEIKKIEQESSLVPEMLVDYFTGKWSECAKPTTSSSHKSAKRLVPNHITMSTNQTCCLFNWRKLRKLPKYLIRSKQYNELCQTTLFNFSWLHAKLTSLGINMLLEDFDLFLSINPSEIENAERFLTAQHSAHLVAQVLRRNSAMITAYPDCLSVELTGQLLCVANFSAPNELDGQNWIDYLIRQCDRSAPWQNVFMPSMPFTYSPVCPLLGTFNCNNEITSMFETTCGNLLVKFMNESCVHSYNMNTGSICVDFDIGYGSLHTYKNGDYGVVVSKKQNGSLKVYKMDSNLRAKTVLIGIIDTSRWLDPQNISDNTKDNSLNEIERKLQQSIKTSVIALSMDAKYVGVIVKSNRLKFNVIDNFQCSKNNSANFDGQVPSYSGSLSGGMNNHVLICELATGKPIHILSPSPLATIIKLVEHEDLKHPKYKGLFFTNSGEQLLGFDSTTGEQIMGVNLLSWPRKVLINLLAKRIFVLCTEPTKTVILHINDKGEVELSYKIVFKNALKDDTIVDIKQAHKMPYLLIQAEKTVLVYDYNNDMIVSNIPQPPGIPKYFKLPNANYQLLTFKDASFAIEDRLVVAAIFRNIVIWDIATSSPLAILHASISLITQLYVGVDGKHLVSYSRPNNQIQLWSLPIAIANAAMLRTMGVKSLPRFEKLTKPIKEIIYLDETDNCMVAAFCEKSDELGLFDVKTGALTDLFTHDADIKTAAKCANSNYLIVGINNKVIKSQKAVVIWCLKTRKIVKEFGDVCGYFVQSQKAGEFYHIFEQEINMYAVSKLVCSYLDEEKVSTVEMTNFKSKIEYLNSSSKPILTGNGKCLCMLSQNYMNGTNEIVIFDLTLDTVNRILLETMQQILSFNAILSIENGSKDSSIIVILSHSKLISDVQANRIIAEYDVVNQNINMLRYFDNLPGGPVGSLIVTKNLNFIGDKYRNSLIALSNSNTDARHKTMYFNELLSGFVDLSSDVTINTFALDDEIAILSSSNSLFALRLQTMTICGIINTPEIITTVTVNGLRTVLVGFVDGSISVYEIIDPVYDGTQCQNLQALIEKIPSRKISRLTSGVYSQITSSTDSNSTIIWPLEPERSWEKQYNETKSCDEINLMKTQVRMTPAEMQWQKSDTIWSMLNERSKTCCIM